ncbi:MAG: glycosyltransferase [Verrucomicrobia bacterium]|nr:glycosyltransferase [Verrucomicrobiota bacterium]
MSNEPLLETTAFELADYLLKNGKGDKAFELLKDLILRNPREISPRSATALARMLYDGKNWQDAGTLWRSLAHSDAATAEAWIKLAHCLIELNQSAEAESCAAKARAILENRPAQQATASADQWLAGLYEQICLHFLGHDLPKLNDILRIFALPGTYLKSVGTVKGPGGLSADLTDEGIRRRLDNALRQWEAAGRTVPYLLQCRGQPSVTRLPQAPPAKKILLVLRKLFLGRADSREHELGVFFQASARAVGLETLFFPADPFLNPTSVTPETQYSELDRLARLILSAKPDLVIFDDLCNRKTEGDYIAPEVYKSVLTTLKAKQPFTLVGFYPDSWTPATIRTIEYVRPFIDVVWHLSHFQSQAESHPTGARMFWAPVPYPENLFQPGAGGKDMGAAFVGSLFDYNCPRGIWLSLIRLQNIPCQLVLSTHTTSGSKAGVTPAEYAAFMSRLRMSVNFSARTTDRKIMTGRAWESIISKSLLLEEDNEEIKRFFVPFVHYVPFRNIHELQTYIRFFDRNETPRRAIAERAFDWFREVFSKERIWSELILGTAS